VATVTHRALFNNSSTTPQTTAAFTPAAGDLIIVFFAATTTVANNPSCVSSIAGQTFTLINSGLSRASVDTIYCFVANQFATAVSQTVTCDTPSDANAGATIYVATAASMSRVGPNAVRQSAFQDNKASASPPTPAFAVAALTANACLGAMMNATNPAGMTPPTSWTEGVTDSGFTTPTTGAEYVFRNSGFTGTTVTWGSNSATASGSVIIELDISVPTQLPASLVMAPRVAA